MLGRQFYLYLQDELKCDLWHIAKSELDKLSDKSVIIKKLGIVIFHGPLLITRTPPS